MVPSNESAAGAVGPPKVSVSLVTYNQKEFIRQAIDSVLEQQTDFRFELIIGDDCSTDGTTEIIRDYHRQYPDVIVPILHPQKNPGLGGKLNFMSTIEAARGEYVALLDGDDYWNDPRKLQKQVAVLDAEPDVSICFHAIRFDYEDKLREPTTSNPGQAISTTFEDLALGNYIPAPSVVFRNRLFGKFPDWFLDTHAGDYPLHLLNADHGTIRFIPDVMAVYRVHSGGVWSKRNRDYVVRNFLDVVDHCQRHFAPRGAREFDLQIGHLKAELSVLHFQDGHYEDCRKYYRECRLRVRDLGLRSYVGLVSRAYASRLPRLAAILRRSKPPPPRIVGGTNA